MLPSLVMPVTVETWLSKPLPVIDPLFSKLPLLVSISVPLEIIEPLLRTPKPMLLPTMLMLLASMPPRLLTSMLYCGLTVIWIRVAFLPAEVTEPELLSMVKLPALTRALLACTLPLILIASASRTA